MSTISMPQPRTALSSPRSWIFWAAILLPLPALIPLLGALIVPLLHNRVPTGFVEYDMPYYLANGRSYFCHGFHLLYSNPYAGYDSPAIYFQPQTLLLGLIQQLGFHPGITFNIVGLLALFFTTTVGIMLYIEMVGVETTAKKIGLICFFWGGGVFTLIGAALALARHGTLLSVFEFEPTWGWWLLNFGRNLVYPLEAYYHGVYLLSLLALIRRRFVLCLVLAALLCASHPFTGLSLILVLIAYSALELMLRSGAATVRFMLAALLIAALQVMYYLVWLNRFIDHQVLQTEWQQSPKSWLYPPKTFIAALLIVGCLAIWRIASSRFSCFQDPRARLFAVMFLVVFALTQNNLVMSPPFQPIHFAHGYDWTALFFIGAPVLISILDATLKISKPLVRWGAMALLLSFFLLDNAAWLTKIAVRNEFMIQLTKDQSGVLNWLSQNVQSGNMVVCQDGTISYLVSTYTPGRSWYGHEKNTPYISQRQHEVNQAFSQGTIQPAWERQGVYFVSPANWVPPAQLHVTQRYGNNEFAIWAAP